MIIIDTSNEIGGDGDLPHPSIGKARRMQVGNPQSQHQIMIEAVENHMPEIIIIDEIGTELEAAAARTIAERGVQLVGTAHGRTLDNLIKNPVLADLIGGIQYVTLGDEEAKRRGSSKSIIERQAAPTFDIGVEIHNPKSWVIHENIGVSIDLLLKGQALALQKREIGKVNKNFIQCKIISSQPELEQLEASTGLLVTDKKQKNNALISRFTQYEYIKFKKATRTKTVANRFIFLYASGINSQDLLSLLKILNLPIILTREIQYADAILALGNLIKNNKKLRQISTVRNISVSSVLNNNLLQLAKALKQIVYKNKDVTKLKNRTIRLQYLGSAFLNPTEEVKLVINEITLLHKRKVNLLPQSYIVRKLQHEQIMLSSLRSKSVGGADLNKRVRIYY